MNTAVAQKHLAEATIAKTRRRLLLKGGENGIRGLSRIFKVVEDDGTSTLTKEEFVSGLRDYGIDITPEELKAVWSYFDRDNKGVLVVTEFITALRGGIGPFRRSLVTRVFDLFEKNSDGAIAVEALRARYDPSGHPAVLKREASEDQIRNQFFESFDATTNPDGLITKQEFEQYYSGVSAAIDDDDYFGAMMRACWRIPAANPDATFSMALNSEGGELLRETRRPTNGPANSYRNFTTTQRIDDKERIAKGLSLRSEFDQLMKLHRGTMLTHKMGFRGVGRLLRQKDVDDVRYLSQPTFLECLWQNRLYFENSALLQFLDTNQDGSVDYQLYMALIMGELPPARQLLLERLWRRLPTDRHGRTDLTVVHRTYRAPDGVALNTFLDAWDARLVPSGKVAFAELLEWMIPISDTLTSDAAFEKLVKEQWVLQS